MTPGLAFLWRSCTKKNVQSNDDVSSIYGTFVGIVGTADIRFHSAVTWAEL